ncbi:hypothetical protein WH87_09465 [Devosia epidermidihirudinis]|uniref:LPS export ABC transporter periplasmic protein LptC n=1 Tax=Devosia epidermidihirudinis TaxID=1293439 RepID=A0A0F5QD09_9HYPH|nr:hypothetical protein [Devosia epidermidihirudinis]KKC37889.1 hypothetical protein WH87_09465 [Devosia epidermidihirudinis]
MDSHGDAAQRLAIYQRLATRNRVVAVLRIGLPLAGAVLLIGLMLQIYISSIANRFGIDKIAVTRDRVTVEAPEYSGLLDDGSAYRVWASMAEAPLTSTDKINLIDAALVVNSPKGTTMNVNTEEALLDTTREQVTIDGRAYFEDSDGTKGEFSRSVFRAESQTLDSQGPVDINYANGTTVIAETMHYDAKAMIWTFSNVSVTLPDTPGSATDGAAIP